MKPPRLMVVFGAGASYDSYALNMDPGLEWRPPLAVQLFSKPQMYAHVEKFRECQFIASRLAALPGGISVEEELERLHAQADGGDPERMSQLMAVRFYLQTGIHLLQFNWQSFTRGVSNYKVLLDQIRSWRLRAKNTEPVCLVTFNYDHFLDEAVWQTLRSDPAESLKAYIATDYKIFKLHGSVDWGREIDTGLPEIMHAVEHDDEPSVARAIIRRAAELQFADNFRVIRSSLIVRADRRGPAYAPAIAIPVQRKQNYECPEEHIRLLDELLPSVTRVVMVGWRGREERFVASMVERLPKDVITLIVSHDIESTSEVKGFLQSSGYPGEFASSAGGFTEFVLKEHFEHFLSWPGDGEEMALL